MKLIFSEVVMRVEQLMEIVSTRNIMVVGDLMLDEYLWGTVRGISPEAPVPVVEIRSKTYALGGAGNVAANLANLGSTVYLAGVVGNDVEAIRLSDLVSATPRISLYGYSCQDRPTTTKTRIIAHSQQMLRTDHEERNLYDVTGAGDTVVAVLALLLATGMEMLEAARLANYAAGIVVGKVGTACVSFEELAGGVE